MKKLKIHTCVLEGIDRCGKTSLRFYLGTMANRNLLVYDRGIVTNVAWNKMLNRDIEYDVDQWKNAVLVYLKVDKEDWKIRCKLTDEKAIDYEQHVKMYDEAFELFKNNGFYVLEFNTSKMTHCQISKKIIKFINDLNGKENEL